jgi:hypothetical protein
MACSQKEADLAGKFSLADKKTGSRLPQISFEFGLAKNLVVNFI